METTKFTPMQVKFVGEMKRINSFGEFEPGHIYDVSKEIGEQLLTSPNLFKRVGEVRMADIAKNQVVDVDSNTDGKYDSNNIHELMDIAKQRGITVRRGARKAELIQILKNQDNENESNDDTDVESVEDSDASV